MNFKKYFYISFIGIIISLLTIVGMVVFVDPYQQYRASDVFIGNQRLENPGVAKHHDYNAVIVGSSMAMNHYPSQVDSLFGWNTINLTITGVLDNDYSKILPYIAHWGKMKHLIMTIDHFSFIRPVIPLDAYLYDNKWLNDLEYWLNYTSLKCTVNKLNSKKELSRDEKYHFTQPCGKELVLNYYNRDNKASYFANYDFDHMEQRFDEMLEMIMPSLSDVNVYIYFPPYSILKFKFYEQYGHLKRILDFKMYVIDALLHYENVKLYDFQREDFICNLDEYMDIFHHSHAYNKRIIECIHADCFRVTEGNYRQDLLVLDSLVRNFEIPN